MRKFYRSVAFSKTPLKSQFRFKDKFQILPIDSKLAPQSPYNKDFPFFIEYFVDFDKNRTPLDIDIFDDLTAQQVAEFEVLNILSVLSNHRFFKYKSNRDQWGIMTPNCGFDKLTHEQTDLYNDQYSSWTFGAYVYPGLRQELKITEYTKLLYPETRFISPYYEYFTNNPVEDEKGEITFPSTIKASLDNYYSLSTKTLKKIKASVALICDGIDISDYKRSLAFLSYVSAIESFVGLEYSDKRVEFDCQNCKTVTNSPFTCQKCGRPIWGIKIKFKEFLKKFVAAAGDSEEVYNKIYNLRCKIAHNGQLFIGDYEFSRDHIDKKEDDWLMRLKTLQLARLSLTNWLRYEKKASS
ncbi:MAG: hypothetical protein RIG77_10630 [Cyclobacteriaceae bacterium]